jgi:signal transduction histidine kinase
VATAAEEARRDLERDLHDGAQQRLAALRFRIGLAQARAADAPGLLALLSEADGALELALEELRELAHGLYPASLDTEGLAAAVAAAADHATVDVTVGPLPGARLPPQIERVAYRVVADVVAGARDAVEIGGTLDANGLVMRLVARGVEDLVGTALVDRVAALGGRVSLDETGPRTVLVAELPCG